MTFWRLDVKDRGEGVSPERKAFLFKRFDQFDVESAAEGHGIGLSVVAALSERFGGRVWVEDRESVDQIRGSMFSVIFPQVKV
jgi:signal transduction histidine kinase